MLRYLHVISLIISAALGSVTGWFLANYVQSFPMYNEFRNRVFLVLDMVYYEPSYLFFMYLFIAACVLVTILISVGFSGMNYDAEDIGSFVMTSLFWFPIAIFFLLVFIGVMLRTIWDTRRKT